MAKKICLVTGANGAIGKAVSAEFKNKNMIVIATDLYLKGIQNEKHLYEYVLDVADNSLLNKFFDEKIYHSGCSRELCWDIEE